MWHDISAKQTTVAIVLDQIGGYCEPRLNVNRPTPRLRYDVGHATFVPAEMPIWGYSDNIKLTRDLRLHFDLDTLPTVLGKDLNYSKATVPILMLYDERVTHCASLLAEECISSLPDNRMYGESLTMALMAALFASHEASNRAVNSGLARWQLRRVFEFLEAHVTEDIGLDELAQQVGLSQSQFARSFKVSTGLPPYQWCLHNRVKREQEMLLNGSDSLSDIWMNALVGFQRKVQEEELDSGILCVFVQPKNRIGKPRNSLIPLPTHRQKYSIQSFAHPKDLFERAPFLVVPESVFL